MLKKLCKCVKKTGKLRKQLSEIDFKQIYEDKTEAAQASFEILEAVNSLTEIQSHLLKHIGRVK